MSTVDARSFKIRQYDENNNNPCPVHCAGGQSFRLPVTPVTFSRNQCSREFATQSWFPNHQWWNRTLITDDREHFSRRKEHKIKIKHYSSTLFRRSHNNEFCSSFVSPNNLIIWWKINNHQCASNEKTKLDSSALYITGWSKAQIEGETCLSGI
jgi:hypothetical protein